MKSSFFAFVLFLQITAQAAPGWDLQSGSIAKQIDCATAGSCNSQTNLANGTYAYAPALLTYQGTRHIFFCSSGQVNVSIDRIRYINDRDAQLKILLDPVGYASRNAEDLAACDPSVVYFQGYFYLFYGSSRVIDLNNPDRGYGNLINVIHVARSARIDGPYQILNQDGSWRSFTERPKHIISPRVLAPSHNQGAGYLGASWPSAVVMGNQLVLWWMDDTEAQPKQTFAPYYMLSTSNPAEWDTFRAIRTNLTASHSAEIKFDRQANAYVKFAVHDAHTPNPWIGVNYSFDGVNWNPTQNAGALPAFSHNMGVMADENGYLLNQQTLQIGFGAPIGLVNDISMAHWNIYAATLNRRW